MYYYFLWSQKWVVHPSNLAIYFQCSKCKRSKVNIRFWRQCSLPFALMFCSYTGRVKYKEQQIQITSLFFRENVNSQTFTDLDVKVERNNNNKSKMDIWSIQWNTWQRVWGTAEVTGSNWQSKSWCANNPQCDPQGIKLLTLSVTDMQPGYMTSSYPQLTANWYITSLMIVFLLLCAWR